jgi:thiamine pyrophosphokinase
MITVAIVGNGPPELLPDLTEWKGSIDVWIGADRGAYLLGQHDLPLDYAVGDFDSMTEKEKSQVKSSAVQFEEYFSEKDETDLELALNKAFSLQPKKMILFGVTGGRLDHELINIQLLYLIVQKGIKGVIIDRQNKIELVLPGKYDVTNDVVYPVISFIPFTAEVENLTLTDFYYPLKDHHVSWGSSLCISNKLISKKGTFSFTKGIVLLIKSKEAFLW